jgi:hypothetical protein
VDSLEIGYVSNHLQSLNTDFDQGEIYSEEIGKVVLDTEFKFHALSDDKITAIFEGDIGEDYRDEVRGRLKERIAETTNAYAYAITGPYHQVQVHRDLNDTPLPGLTFDAENIHLSLNWRELYTRFYGEELAYHNGLKNWHTDNEALKDELVGKAGTGQAGMMEALMKAVHAFANGSDEIRKVTRRARIQRQFKEIGDDWDFESTGDPDEEKQVLNRLAEARQLTSMEDDSDFDRDESEEDGSEEEDEWEDASNDDIGEEDVDEEEEFNA